MSDLVSSGPPKAIPAPRDQHLRDLANCIRFLSMDAVQNAKSGHPGAPMGMADIATVLFSEFMQFDSAEPHWIDRDRFILSNGHASMLLYSLLYLTGYQDMPIEELQRFRQVGSRTPGHPEYRHADGIELTTGPLGQGVAESVASIDIIIGRFLPELSNPPDEIVAVDPKFWRPAPPGSRPQSPGPAGQTSTPAPPRSAASRPPVSPR